MSKFETFDVSVLMIKSIKILLEKLATKDANLEDQLRRAASSASLNIAEGSRKTGKDRLNRFRIAAGSTSEVVAGLKIAEAWGYLGAEEIASTVGFCDRMLAMLYRLTHTR